MLDPSDDFFKSSVLRAPGPDVTGKAKLSSTPLSALQKVQGCVVFQPEEKETWHPFQLNEPDLVNSSVSRIDKNLGLG